MLYSKIPFELSIYPFEIMSHICIYDVIALQYLSKIWIQLLFHLGKRTQFLSNVKGQMRLYFPRAELVKFIWQSTEFLISYKVQLCFHILVLSPFTNIYIPIIFLVHMLRNKCLELISWMRIFIQPAVLQVRRIDDNKEC